MRRLLSLALMASPICVHAQTITCNPTTINVICETTPAAPPLSAGVDKLFAGLAAVKEANAEKRATAARAALDQKIAERLGHRDCKGALDAAFAANDLERAGLVAKICADSSAPAQ